MSQDVAADSSSATPEAFSDVAELFYPEKKPLAESAPAEEEHPSEQADEASETESESDPENETEEASEQPQAPKPESKAEKRIKQLVAEKKKLEEQLRASKPVTPKPETPIKETKVEEAKEPEPGQFETWDAYQTAHRDFLQKQIDSKVKDAIEQDRTAQAQKAAEQKRNDELAKAHKVMVDRQKETEKRIPDLKAKLFDESGALREDIQIHPVFDAFIPKSEVGWDILHHIATHPEDAAKIAAMDEFEAAGEFHRLHSEITAKLKAPPIKQPPKPSRVLSGTGSTPKPKSPEELFYGDD